MYKNSSYFYHRESWQNLTLSIHFDFFSIYKQKAKMKSATECYRPKIRTNKALEKYHYRKQNKKSFWSCLLFSFGNSILVYYKHCFIKRREKKLLRRLSATRDSKLNSWKWNKRICLFNPKTWDFDPKSSLKFGGKRWDFVSKGKLLKFILTTPWIQKFRTHKLTFFVEIKFACSFLKTSTGSLKVLLPR